MGLHLNLEFGAKSYPNRKLGSSLEPDFEAKHGIG